jgi:sugar phosphate isomerase/epimerase
VYSAREEAQKDLDSVLKQLKRIGYDGVEFAGFYNHSARDIRDMLTQHGLVAISSHVPFQNIADDMFGAIAYHQAIGCPYIAIPYLDDQTRPGAAGFAKTLQSIIRFGGLVREAGMTLLYHNHDFEFVTLSGQYALDFLYDAVSPSLLQTEIDTCWVKFAGLDPAEYIRKYAGRCPVVHLKDYIGGQSGFTPYALIGQAETANRETGAFEFRPVGYGCQDVASLVSAGIESGAEWFVVEQDMSVGRTPLEAAAMSMETLIKLGLKA